MQQISSITEAVVNTLGLDSALINNPIYIGKRNKTHMKNKHPEDFEKYESEISNILDHPDYVGLNEKDSSIEYVKRFETNNEYVKVPVRESNGRYIARSLYTLNNNRTINFISKNTLKPVEKNEK